MKHATSITVLAIVLVANIGCGTSGAGSSLSNSSAQLRVVQGASDTGSVDVLVNGKKLLSTPAQPGPVIPNYFPVNPGSLRFQEVPEGSNGPDLVDTTVSVASSSYDSVVVMGRRMNGSLATLALVDDHSSPPAGQIKVRLVHGSSAAGPVDIYVAKSGDPVPSTPTVPNFTFKSATPYLQLPAENFQVCLSPPGIVPVSMLQCGLASVEILVAAQSPRNSTFAFFDPPMLSGNPGQFTSPVQWQLLPDLR